jgi:hypothetical protein
MSVAQRPFLTACNRSEQPDQTRALDGARSNELETPVTFNLEFLVRPGPEASDGFEAAPPGVRPHVAGV